MITPRNAAIYARVSSDPTGTALGVQRQLEDCRKLATQRGWTVAEEYVDNDVSALKGAHRPAYERMLDDLRDGYRDGVIVYHLDRLTRRPIELEHFTEVAEAAGVTQFATVSGDINLGNGDGLLIARIHAAVAAQESQRKSERVRRKAQQNAEAGKPGGGKQRPFGYNADKITINEPEADAIREIVDRFLAGESLRSLTNWLDEIGMEPTNGGQWRSVTLRNILRSGRIAGLREYRGEVVATAVWEGIITPEKRDRVLALMEQRKTSGRRAVRTHLLTGLLRCGLCSGRLFSSSRPGEKMRERRYVCMSGPDHRGCGKITVTAVAIESLIIEAVLYRLDTPTLQDSLAGRKAADERLLKLRDQLERDRDQMKDLAVMWADGELTRESWKTARDRIQPRIDQAERALAQSSSTPTLEALAGRGAELRTTWDTMNLGRQSAILGAVLDCANVQPATKPGRFTPDRVEPVWAL